MGEIVLTKRVKYAGDVFKELTERAGFPVDLAVNFLNNIPDADAVPVVRCKYCRASELCPTNNYHLWCNVWDTVVRTDGYCNHAEKMDAKDTNVPTKDGGAE